MEAELCDALSGTPGEVDGKLAALMPKIQAEKAFPYLTAERRKALSECAVGLLSSSPSSRVGVLSFLRVVARDASGLELLLTPPLLAQIRAFAGLNKTLTSEDPSCEIEAVKVLCNAGFVSAELRKQLIGEPFSFLCERLAYYGAEENSWSDIALVRFLLRYFFVMTATEGSLREKARREEGALGALTNLLAKILKESTLSLGEAEAAEELLKSLFNVSMGLKNAKVIEDTEEALCIRLVQLCRRLLEIKVGPFSDACIFSVPSSPSLGSGLASHAVNLLTALPPLPAFHHLSARLGEGGGKTYMGRDTTAWLALIAFLKQRLEAYGANAGEGSSGLVPVLVVLGELAGTQRSARKFLRWKILPPLGAEVMRRPEDGASLRNRLAKLLTAADGQTPHLAAELLFQLCKRNVERLIKYTGFGNAAGLLANQGLLGGQRQDEGEAMSTDDDSDTEEYINAKPNVNPVTGCFETDGPNPMEGMSDEQKEHEAMRLVAEIDKLMAQGVIKPATIGPDGKPQPVEHILELTKHLKPTEEQASSDDDN